MKKKKKKNKKMRLIHTGIFVFIFSFLMQGIAVGFPVDSDSDIRAISVSCEFMVDIPLQVRNKIQSTLLKTLESVLLEKDGNSLENYIRAKDEIESRLINGLNIVFEPKGYAIDSLDLTFAKTTHANFVVKPYRKYVQDVSFEIETGNFHPFWSERFQNVFNNSSFRMSEYYSKVLNGLPVGAEDSDWAFQQIQEDAQDKTILNDMFPDMRVDVDVRIDETTVVRVELSPLEPTAKTLRVRTYSRSVFQLVLEPLKELVTSHSNIVVGIPISWIENAKSDIENEFNRIVSEDLIARKLDLNTVCNVYFIENSPNAVFLEVKTESGTWNLNAEMMIDVGNDEHPTEFKGHFGLMMSDFFECFALMNFFPDEITFRPDVGIGIHPLDGTFVAGAWDINTGDLKFYAKQYLTRDIRIEAEVFTKDDQQDQFGLVYKPFQYVSFGLFSDGDEDYWLRVAFAF